MMRFFLPKGQWPREQAALDDHALRNIGSFLTQKDLSALARTCKELYLLFNTPPNELGDNALTIRYVAYITMQLIDIERNTRGLSWSNIISYIKNYPPIDNNYMYFEVLERKAEYLSNQLAKTNSGAYANDLSSLFIGYLIYCMTNYDQEESAQEHKNTKVVPAYPPINLHGWYKRYIGNSPRPPKIEIEDLMLFIGRFVISSDNNKFMNRAILTAEDDRFRYRKHFFPHFAKKADEIEKLIHATRELHKAMQHDGPSNSRTPG